MATVVRDPVPLILDGVVMLLPVDAHAFAVEIYQAPADL
jgi:hypothetical protein